MHTVSKIFPSFILGSFCWQAARHSRKMAAKTTEKILLRFFIGLPPCTLQPPPGIRERPTGLFMKILYIFLHRSKVHFRNLRLK